MPTDEVPQFTNVLTFSNDLAQTPTSLVEFIDVEKRKLSRPRNETFTDEIAVAHLLKRTGIEFLQGLSNPRVGKNFYPGGIQWKEPGAEFTKANTEQKKVILANYAASVYGIAVQMIDHMMRTKIGIFPVEEFISAYNEQVVRGTNFPPLVLEHFKARNAKDVKISYTDDGRGEIIPYDDMEKLIAEYESKGILYLFDNNQLHQYLPKSLLWFFKNQKLNDSIPLIHGEVRKLVRVLRTGRREVSKQIAQQLIAEDFPWKEGFPTGPSQPQETNDPWDRMLHSLLNTFEN